MSDRTSFYYDPVRQGYDTNSWRTLSGAPAVTGSGRILVDAGTGTDGAAVHYADILKGDISFNVNVPTAPGGDDRKFGVAGLSDLAYIRFAISSDLRCQTSDGTTTTNSAAITWDPAWTGANMIYRIRWEAGTAKFFINGTQVYAITDGSVPAGPLSLYLFDNSTSAMTIGDMNVRGTQSFVMNPKTSDSSSNVPGGDISTFQSVTVTEGVTILLPTLFMPWNAGTNFDSVTVSENVVMLAKALFSVSDAVTITESRTLTIV